jgi:hypothetical protein
MNFPFTADHEVGMLAWLKVSGTLFINTARPAVQNFMSLEKSVTLKILTRGHDGAYLFRKTLNIDPA